MYESIHDHLAIWVYRPAYLAIDILHKNMHNIAMKDILEGKIDISKLRSLPEKHEYDTARYFADRGHDVTFIPPNNSPNMHTPDFTMDGVDWEVKCPQGKAKRTIENNFRKAAMQSKNIIIDLRRIQLEETICLPQIERELNGRPYIKRLLVIKKNGVLIDLTSKKG